MIKLISSKVARILCKDEKHTDNYELYEYAIYIILFSAFHMATVIVLGLVFNLLTESLVFYLSFIVIRKFAGGYHAKTPTRCYIIYIITWVQAQHVFAEPGYNASSGVYTVINNSKASWRGKMNSWWWGGKNCSATGKITAI